MTHERAINAHGRELDYCKNCGWHWWPALFDGHRGWDCVPHIVAAFQQAQADPRPRSWTSYALDTPEIPVHEQEE